MLFDNQQINKHATIATMSATDESKDSSTSVSESEGGSVDTVAATHTVFMPGRVCLLGEHSDWVSGHQLHCCWTMLFDTQTQ